jgi:glycosyltransferase involved in cell wall biosynthesis
LSTAVRPLHAGQSAEALIFHLWGPHGAAWLLDAFRAPKAVYYHTITPPHFFAHDTNLRTSMERGLQQLAARADSFDLALAPSHYDLDDFMAYRTRPVPGVVVPPVVDAAELTAEPSDDALVRAMRVDGSVNIVFVGRLTPNKCQHRLVDLFEFYSREINPNSRLWLVGSDRDAVYSSEVRSRIQRSPVRHRIVVTGHVSRAHLLAYLRGADVYVSASEHEGFGIPLAQAMAFDLPIVALGCAGVPETMGGTGVVVDDWDVSRLAPVVDELVYDEDLRGMVIAGQRRNLARFSEQEATRGLAAAVLFLREGIASADLVELHPRSEPESTTGELP